MFRPNTWTAEEEVKLRELVKTKTIPHIAVELGRTNHMVRARIEKLGLSTQVPWARPPELVREIAAYVAEHGYPATRARYNLTKDALTCLLRRRRRLQKELVENTSHEKLQGLRKAARKLAYDKGRDEFADDFSSFATVRYLMSGNPNRKLKLQWVWVDFLRDLNADARTRAGQAQVNALSKTDVILEGFEEDVRSVQVEASTQDELYVSRIAQEFELEGEERMIFILRFHFNFRLEELALLFDQTGSRMSQRLDEITTKLRQRGIRREDLSSR